MVGSGAVSNQVADVTEAEVIIIIGSNPTVNHPVAATFMKNASKEGKTLIVMDPKKTDISRHANYYLQFKPDTDVAMLNAIMKSIIDQDLVDKEFIKTRTKDYDKLRNHLKDYSPKIMSKICGISEETLNEVARLYASSKGSMIFWGMGVSQHIHGTDNATGINIACINDRTNWQAWHRITPLRGPNNVQGASDAGLIPMVFQIIKE